MKVFRWLLLWLMLVVVIGTIVGQQSWNYYRLSKRGIVVQGVAGTRQPHGQIAYEFTANGQVYHEVGVPSARDLSAGDSVPVTYLPEEPSANCLGDPGARYSNELPIVLVASFFFPTFIVIVVACRSARRTRLVEERQPNI